MSRGVHKLVFSDVHRGYIIAPMDRITKTSAEEKETSEN